MFLPSNTTSVLQHIDAGIIRNLKHYYKKTVVTKMIHKYDSDASTIFKMSVLDAIRILDDSWEYVIGFAIPGKWTTPFPGKFFETRTFFNL